MKSFAVLGLLMTLSLSTANAKGLDQACLSQVVAAVNKYDTYPGGSVYALRILKHGASSSEILIGHSDEVDPTDYLVKVKHQSSKCKVLSIDFSTDGADVADYTDAETKAVADIMIQQEKVLTEKALQLFKKIAVSGYDNRLLCIKDGIVTARVPMTNWASNDRKTATGTLNSFPRKITAGEPGLATAGKKTLVSESEFQRIYKVSGYFTDSEDSADLCLIEDKILLEQVQ